MSCAWGIVVSKLTVLLDKISWVALTMFKTGILPAPEGKSELETKARNFSPLALC